MGFALLDKNGSYIKHLSDVLPPEIELTDGQILSYLGMLESDQSTTEFTFRVEGAEGRAYREPNSVKYNVRAWGTDLKAIDHVIKELSATLGSVSLTPKYLPLPNLAGAWTRLMFIFRYIAYGTVPQ